MVQAIFETAFDACYLTGVVLAGLFMVKRGAGNPLAQKFGWMAVLLGAGDAFHLVPRVWALWTTGIDANAAALGIGKLITSVTMTAFYLILYYIWRDQYKIEGRSGLTVVMWVLAAARVVLSVLPQNDWLSADPPLFWGILRNIPFALMGILIIWLFWREVGRTQDTVFRFMPLAVLLSFGFYVPVVLFSDAVTAIGMLMIPKTLAYVWIVWMGWKLYKQGGRAA